MEFQEGVAVYTPDGRHLGNVDRVVVDPTTRRVTHIVIRQGHLLPEDKVIPVERLTTATEERIVLDSEPGDLTPFEESHYVPLDEETMRQWGFERGAPLLWGGWMTGANVFWGMTARTEQHIPEGDVAVAEGATVADSNGEHVGRVLELVTDPKSGRITYLVIEAGHLWGKHTKAIPINWVSVFGEWQVTLAVGRQTLDNVPAHHPT
jgi:sporulation protein YlmC with PRC-barrel domain